MSGGVNEKAYDYTVGKIRAVSNGAGRGHKDRGLYAFPGIVDLDAILFVQRGN